MAFLIDVNILYSCVLGGSDRFYYLNKEKKSLDAFLYQVVSTMQVVKISSLDIYGIIILLVPCPP